MKTAILINDTSKERHLGCDAVIKNIFHLCKINQIEVIATFTRPDVKGRSSKVISAINSCDIVIVNGEGSLHDSYGRNFFLPLLNMIPKGKKAVLINSVWHNMGEVKDLDKFSLISVRERNSFDELITMYPRHDKVYIVPDVIFYTEVPDKLNIGHGDSVKGNITSKLNGHNNYFPLDYRRKFKTKYNEIALKNDDIKSYLKWLKTLDLYITGRFHGVCLSALAGTPFLAFASNAKKIEGILRNMRCEELLIKSLDEIETKKELAFKLAPRAHLYAIDAKRKIEALFKNIRDIAYDTKNTSNIG